LFAEKPVNVQQAQTARTTIKAIFNGVRSYHIDRNRWPASLDDLFEETGSKLDLSDTLAEATRYSYLEISPADTQEWNYELEYDGPPSIIRARAKNIRVRADGHTTFPATVNFDVQSGIFLEYGAPNYGHDTLTHQQEAELAEDVKAAMPLLWDAIKMYGNDKGYSPDNVASLVREHYVEFLPSLFLQWQFAFVGLPPHPMRFSPRSIIATSTYFMPDGAGKTVEFNGDSLTWRGYGCPPK